MRGIAIVDYGMGNIGSVANALRQLDAPHFVTSDPAALHDARGIILPGVGAFSAAMQNLRVRGLDLGLTEAVVERKTPFLGVCLGMQLIAQDSTELGYSKGLGWIEGHVVRMETAGDLAVPHVGWNELGEQSRGPLLDTLGGTAHFYFDHSYTLKCAPELVTATCEYGGSWVAAVQKDNIHAVQFHPEKSQRNGLRLLRNFLNLVGAEAAC